MANRKSDWRDRRWKIFEKVYNNDEAFRAELEKINLASPSDHTLVRLLALLANYDLSFNPEAVISFQLDPDHKKESFTNALSPLIDVWSASYMSIYPESFDFTVVNSYKLAKIINDFEIPIEKVYNFVQDILKSIALDTTIIQVRPYTNKTELHQLIDDYWDKLEPLINFRSDTGDTLSGKTVLGKVQSDRLRKLQERDNLIVELHEKGLSDEAIATKLIEEKYGAFELNNIRQIRHRAKNNK